jgi:stage II sporulation protein AA (anti-sigma F factor antagonist)
MEVRESSLSGVPLVLVKGDVDHENAPLLEKAIRRALGVESGRVLVDLTDCPYIDSGGLAALLTVLKGVQGRGWLGIIGPNGNVLRVFDIVGLIPRPGFRIFASTEEASTAVADDR